MRRERRRLLSATGALVLYAVAAPRAGAAGAAAEVEIVMSGTPTGSEVWFRPRGLLIAPGQSVRWTNRQTGNVHTTTAYHPANGKPLRIPDGAKPWNSNYLMPEQSFVVTFEIPGVYDYFCIPHEQAGMVGRIVVGHVDAATRPYAATDSKLPAAALARLADVASIVKAGRVE